MSMKNYFKSFLLVMTCTVLFGGAATSVYAATATYTVKTGETLDQVIKKTMNESPLKIEILRQAFMQQNPHAFTNTLPKLLKAGAVLTIPDEEFIMRNSAGKKNGAGDSRYANDLNNERKNWVRYP
jgi:hypothetical protein